MGGRWTTRRRSQTRIEENHTARHHEKVGYLATDSSGRKRRARYSTGGCADLKALLRDLQNEAPLPTGKTRSLRRILTCAAHGLFKLADDWAWVEVISGT